MSAFLPKADIRFTLRHVRFVPIADIRIAAKRCSPRYNRQLQGKMPEAQMNREAVLVIAELMWALRRSGAHTFFPDMPLHKARKLVLVGATVGLAHLRGRPVTLASLSRQLVSNDPQRY